MNRRPEPLLHTIGAYAAAGIVFVAAILAMVAFG